MGLVSLPPAAAILVFEQYEVRGEFAFEGGLLAAGSNGVDQLPQESSEVTHYSASLVNSRLTIFLSVATFNLIWKCSRPSLRINEEPASRLLFSGLPSPFDPTPLLQPNERRIVL